MAARFQLVGALLDLLFQAGIGFLQLPRHGVELFCKRFELVPSLDGDALAEVAATEACGTQPQRLDRADHPAGEKHPSEHGDEKRGQQHEAQTLESRVERRIGLLGRQLDEHQPAERRHSRISGEHPAPLDILRFLHRLRWIVAGVGTTGGDAGARRAHLRELRHVGIAQYEADIGMRDQPSLCVNDIGVTALADLDLRDHVPDELEIDFRDAEMAGTWRNRRKASKRRCSIEPADHGSCVVQPSWLSISLMNWPILAAAASACSRWMRMSDALCS